MHTFNDLGERVGVGAGAGGAGGLFNPANPFAMIPEEQGLDAIPPARDVDVDIVPVRIDEESIGPLGFLFA